MCRTRVGHIRSESRCFCRIYCFRFHLLLYSKKRLYLGHKKVISNKCIISPFSPPNFFQVGPHVTNTFGGDAMPVSCIPGEIIYYSKNILNIIRCACCSYSALFFIDFFCVNYVVVNIDIIIAEQVN